MDTASSQPTISMMKLRSQPGSVIDEVFYKNESFIIERSGQPRAVLVPLQQYNEMKRIKALEKERFFELVDKTRARNKDIDPKVIQKTIDEAVAEVRNISSKK